MINLNKLLNQQPKLQSYQWPPLSNYSGMSDEMAAFMDLSREQQRAAYHEMRGSEGYEEFLNTKLAFISSYLFSYCDGPLHLSIDEDLEFKIQQLKLVTESEVIDHWIKSSNESVEFKSSNDAADYLIALSEDNSGLNHPLFDFLEHEANEETFKIFLRNEVCRNEVVDDEVAVMTTGIQGAMKAAVCSNLWDEVGGGHLIKYHTYWLRRLVESYGDWDHLLEYRAKERPWFTMITTNVFNILLTRPGLKFRRYGWFLLNEGWVSPHFKKVLNGMDRLNIKCEDIRIYFKAHESIDPRHTEELIEAFRHQQPTLSEKQVSEVILGARMSLEASIVQYDHMLDYLKAINNGKIIHTV